MGIAGFPEYGEAEDSSRLVLVVLDHLPPLRDWLRFPEGPDRNTAAGHADLRTLPGMGALSLGELWL
jgi:hypothetical protein